MDRFVTKMTERAVLSPTPSNMAAASHKRAADLDTIDSSRSPKKAKPAADDSHSLPHFPSHSLLWLPAAQSFYDSLSHSHRSPFVHLVNEILESNSLLQSTSLSTSPVPTPTASTTPPPAVPSVDMSTVLCTFVDLSFVQPRGKFDVHVTDNAFILSSSGKQPSTTVLPFTSLEQLAAVPDVNKKDWCVLLRLREEAAPLMAGKTPQHQLLLKVDATRKTTDAKAIRIPQHTNPTDPLPNVTIAAHFLSALRKYCPRVPLITPETSTFHSTAATPSISCYHGTSDGQLYPLSAGLLFIQRPLVWLPLDAVDGMEVTRSGGGKTFDLKVGVKRMGEKEEVVTFSMISVKEQQALDSYVHYVAKWQKKREKDEKAAASLKQTAAGSESATAQQVEASEQATKEDDSDSDADSDFDPDGSSDEDGGDDAGSADSGSDGNSDSDDSQFNSDIDVEAEVSAEDIVKERKRRSRAVQSSAPHIDQPVDHDDSDESEAEQQQSEAVNGHSQADDDELTSTSSSSDLEEEQNKRLQQQDKGEDGEDGRDNVSRFRNVIAAETSKEESNGSDTSVEEDGVITIE